MRSLGYMPNEVELEVIIQRLDMDGKAWEHYLFFIVILYNKSKLLLIPSSSIVYCLFIQITVDSNLTVVPVYLQTMCVS